LSLGIALAALLFEVETTLKDRVVAAARRDHQLALTCHVDAEIDGRVGRKRNIADIAGKHAFDLVFKVFDVNLGDDAEAFLLRTSVVRRTASSKPTGSVLLK
jgi:hypothetical protein